MAGAPKRAGQRFQQILQRGAHERTFSTASTGRPGRSSPLTEDRANAVEFGFGNQRSPPGNKDFPVFSSVKLSAETVRTVPVNNGIERLWMLRNRIWAFCPGKASSASSWRKLNLNDQLASVRDNVHQLLTEARPRRPR